MSDIYLVYVNFHGKPHPQKWFGSKVNPNNSKPYPEGFFACEPILLKEQDRNLTLAELCERYPPPTKKESENAEG